MIKSPCYQCPDREIGCHSKCEQYLSYQTEIREWNKNDYQRRERENDYMSVATRKRGNRS